MANEALTLLSEIKGNAKDQDPYAERLLVSRDNKDDQPVPRYGTSGSAGIDLTAFEAGVIPPGSDMMVRTGLHFRFPEGYFGLIKARSGLSKKNKIEVGAGVIDNDYTGEVLIHLYNHGSSPFPFQKNDRIAQMLTLPYAQLEIHPVSDIAQIPKTDRGDKGFGSTGVSS
jgi:dUTP pyrophosphatase